MLYVELKYDTFSEIYNLWCSFKKTYTLEKKNLEKEIQHHIVHPAIYL